MHTNVTTVLTPSVITLSEIDYFDVLYTDSKKSSVITPTPRITVPNMTVAGMTHSEDRDCLKGTQSPESRTIIMPPIFPWRNENGGHEPKQPPITIKPGPPVGGGGIQCPGCAPPCVFPLWPLFCPPAIHLGFMGWRNLLPGCPFCKPPWGQFPPNGVDGFIDPNLDPITNRVLPLPTPAGGADPENKPTSVTASCTAKSTVTNKFLSCPRSTKGTQPVSCRTSTSKSTGCSITPTTTTTYGSCTALSTITNEYVTCFASNGTKSTLCHPYTSVVATGCDMTGSTITSYGACPILDPNEPQGDGK